jgi:hypothetical protein
MQLGRGRRLAAGVVLLMPIALAAQRPAPVPPDVLSACSIADGVGSKTPGTKLQRNNGAFRDEMIAEPVNGCRVVIDGSFKKLGDGRLPSERLGDLFEAQGWTQLPEFSSDGHDGGSFAYKRRNVACVTRGQWDGGSDDDPAAPPADPYRITVLCGDAAAVIRPR